MFFVIFKSIYFLCKYTPAFTSIALHISAYWFSITKMLPHKYYNKFTQIDNIFLKSYAVMLCSKPIFEDKGIKYHSAFIYVQKTLQNKAFKRTKV